jgi:hypothetical protein
VDRASFVTRVEAIDWCRFDTAYGPAAEVPALLRRLADVHSIRALRACDRLDWSLCHQHVQVGSAALPALPFLLEVLDSAEPPLLAAILDLLLGLAKVSKPGWFADAQRSLGRLPLPEEEWTGDLRRALVAELLRFREFAVHSATEVSDTAAQLVAELAGANA